MKITHDQYFRCIGISFFLHLLFYIWLWGELSPATHPYQLSDNAHGWVHLHFHCNKLNVPWNRLISKHRWPNNFTYYMTWLDWKIKHLFWLFALPGAAAHSLTFLGHDSSNALLWRCIHGATNLSSKRCPYQPRSWTRFGARDSKKDLPSIRQAEAFQLWSGGLFDG